MYILTVAGKESQGAYSATDDDGEQVLYLFEQSDDATRFAYQLEDEGYPEMNVVEVEDEVETEDETEVEAELEDQQ